MSIAALRFASESVAQPARAAGLSMYPLRPMTSFPDQEITMTYGRGSGLSASFSIARSAASRDSASPLPHVISDQTSCLCPNSVRLFSLMMVPTSVFAPSLTNALKESPKKQIVDRGFPRAEEDIESLSRSLFENTRSTCQR